MPPGGLQHHSVQTAEGAVTLPAELRSTQWLAMQQPQRQQKEPWPRSLPRTGRYVLTAGVNIITLWAVSPYFYALVLLGLFSLHWWAYTMVPLLQSDRFYLTENPCICTDIDSTPLTQQLPPAWLSNQNWIRWTKMHNICRTCLCWTPQAQSRSVWHQVLLCTSSKPDVTLN